MAALARKARFQYPAHMPRLSTLPPVGERRPDRRAVSDWTLDRLNEMVFNGELKAGDVLSEVDLTERLQVSRSPVREALKELENAGLLDVDVVNGRRVLRPFVADDVAELYDTRTELEALAARYAARSPTQVFLDELEQRLDEMRAAVGEPVETWLPKDFAFHSAISVGSGARRAPHLLAGVWIQHQALLRRMALVGSYPSTFEERMVVIEDHRKILLAISKSDPARADAALRAHLDQGRQKVLTALRKRGSSGV